MRQCLQQCQFFWVASNGLHGNEWICSHRHLCQQLLLQHIYLNGNFILALLLTLCEWTLKPRSHRASALMLPLTLLNQSRAHLNFDASVDADTDTWWEWCNWNKCIPFKSQISKKAVSQFLLNNTKVMSGGSLSFAESEGSGSDNVFSCSFNH